MVCVPWVLTAEGWGSPLDPPFAVISGGSQELVGFQGCPVPVPASMMTGMESLPRTGDAVAEGPALTLLASGVAKGPCLIVGWKPACTQMHHETWKRCQSLAKHVPEYSKASQPDGQHARK